MVRDQQAHLVSLLCVVIVLTVQCSYAIDVYWGGKPLCSFRKGRCFVLTVMHATSYPGTVFGVGVLLKEKQDRFGGKDWCGSALPLPPLTLLSQQLCQPWERF